MVLYTRPGCHLCEDAGDILRPLAERYGVEVQAINIEDDDAAYERWWDAIPVIVAGPAVLRAPIDWSALRTALQQVRSAS